MLMGSIGLQQVKVCGVEVEQIVSATESTLVVDLGDVNQAATNSIYLLAQSQASVLVTGAIDGCLDRGSVALMSPNTGQDGTRVSITGTDLLGGGSLIDSVTFGGVSVSLDGCGTAGCNSEVLVVDVGGGAVGTAVDVVLTSNTGSRVTALAAWTAVQAGAVSTVTPAFGQVGTRVVISGSNMLGGGSSIISVNLGGLEVGAITVDNSDTEIHVVSVSGDSGAAAGDSIVLVADSGAITTQAGVWTYISPGDVTSVSPSEGQFGTVVTISGSNLLGGGTDFSSIMLAGIEVGGVGAYSDTDIEVIVAEPTAASVGDVVITSTSGAQVTESNGFSYLTQGVLQDVVPASGVGGTVVVITGERMLGGGTTSDAVTFGSLLVERYISVTDSRIEVAVAVSATSTVGSDIVIISDTGAVTLLPGAWDYLSAGVIGSVSPSSGQFNTQVTLAGTGLRAGGGGVVSVTLAGVEQGFVTESDSEVTLVVVRPPFQDDRNGDIILTADSGGRTTLSGGWDYKTEGSILSVQPNSGKEGTEIILYGVSLFGHGRNIGTLTLAGVQATITDQRDIYVYATVAAGSEQTGDVVITADTGATITSANAWSYIAEPAISDISPPQGQDGTLFEVTGTNLLAGGSTLQELTFGGVKAEIVSFSNTAISGRILPGAAVGLVDVRILVDTGAFVEVADAWRYLDMGDIDTVEPGSGQTGTVVTINGNNLLGGGSTITEMTLAGTPVSDILEQSDGRIVVIVAPAAAAVGDIYIKTDSGAEVIRLGGWRYLDDGAITNVFPPQGAGWDAGHNYW